MEALYIQMLMHTFTINNSQNMLHNFVEYKTEKLVARHLHLKLMNRSTSVQNY